MIRRKLLQVRYLLSIFIGILILSLISPLKIFASPIIEEKSGEWTPFTLAVLIIGGSIALTLIYVSWRKYKGGKKIINNKDKMID